MQPSWAAAEGTFDSQTPSLGTKHDGHRQQIRYGADGADRLSRLWAAVAPQEVTANGAYSFFHSQDIEAFLLSAHVRP